MARLNLCKQFSKAAALLCLVLNMPMAALGQNFQWIRQFGTAPSDSALGVVASSSGVYVVGNSAAQGSQINLYLRKFSGAGSEQWNKTLFQLPSGGSFSVAGVATDDTGEYAAGSRQSSLGGATAQVFVKKVAPDGSDLWTGAASSGDENGSAAVGVAVDATGVYIVGSFFRKYDLNGNVLWTKQFEPSIDALAIATDPNSGVYVVGTVTAGALSGQSSSGGQDAFLRKYDSSGNIQWTSQFGSTGNDSAKGVTANGGAVYVVGIAGATLPGQSPIGAQDAFIKKYDVGGSALWTRQFGTFSADSALSVAADPTGSYVAGQVGDALPLQSSVGGSDAYVRKYDPDGNERWTKEFGSVSSDVADAIAVDATGVYSAGATSGIFSGQSSAGPFLTKQDLGGPPYLPFNGIVNGASYVRSVAAGSIASAFGLSLTPQNPATFKVLAGTTTSPVYADTPAQINFQVPWEVAGQSVFLTINADGNSSSPVSIPLATYAPGIFSTDQSGSGQGAILIANTAIVAAPTGSLPGSRPVSRGESIQIYCTGLGPVSNQPPTGVAASGSSMTPLTPTVMVGGVSVPVSFSGLAPGFFGLYQVNVQIVGTVPTGSAIPVTLSIGGAMSNTVTIAVQ